MKHLMTLMALVVAVTAGAQVMDTIVIGNEVHINLNYAKVDSIISDLQAQVDSLEAAPTFGADLTAADLTGADLTGVTWTGARILNCTGCTCIDNDNDNYCD